MSRLAAAALIGWSLLAATPVRADFGAADVTGINNEARTFSAWCAKKKNDCLVTFQADGIAVNDGRPVPYENIVNFHFHENDGTCNSYGFWCIGRLYRFDIVYNKDNGMQGVGKIMFANKDVALTFLHNLNIHTGNKPKTLDPRCAQGLVMHKGACVSDRERLLLQRDDQQRAFDRNQKMIKNMQEARRIEVEALDAITPDTVIQQNQMNQKNQIIQQNHLNQQNQFNW